MVLAHYPVFAEKDLEKAVNSLTENFQLKVEQHISSEIFECYVLVDGNGNHVDVFHHAMIAEQGLYAMRVDVDDFDAMVASLKAQGYEYAVRPFEFYSATIAVMENPNNPVAHRYMVFQHKNG